MRCEFEKVTIISLFFISRKINSVFIFHFRMMPATDSHVDVDVLKRNIVV